MPEVFTPDFRVETVGTRSYTFNASVATSYRNVPEKVSGAWIHYPDGSRFRRPTAYARAGWGIVRGSSEKMSGYNAFSRQPWSVTTGPGGLLHNAESFFTDFSSYGVPNLDGAPGFAFLERNEASTKALEKIADGKANFAESLATMGQTARMIQDPARKLIDNIYEFRGQKSLWPLATRSYRDLLRGGTSAKLAGLYLQYVYGVKPIIEDIHGIMTMMKEAGLKPLFLSSHGTAIRSYSPSDRHVINASRERDEYLEGTSLASRTRCSVWAKLSPEWQAIRALNQLNWINPLGLAWELIPYSFVLDWFVPIGSMLGSLTAPAGLDFVGGSTSRSVAIAATLRNQQHAFAGWVIETQSPGTAGLNYLGYRREPLYTWPTPGVYFDQDPLGLSRDGSDRTLKALALATVRLPRL